MGKTHHIKSMLDESELKQRSKGFATSLGGHPGIDETVKAVESILTA